MGVPLSSAYGAVVAADQRIMRHLNHWRAPRWLQWWMIAATRCGDGWLWALDSYGGPLVWHVQLRRGLVKWTTRDGVEREDSATAVVGVEFSAADVRKAAD